MIVSFCSRVLLFLSLIGSVPATSTICASYDPILYKPDTIRMSSLVTRHPFRMDQPAYTLSICQLTVGQRYQLSLHQDNASCVAQLSMTDHSLQGGGRSGLPRQFMARSTCAELVIKPSPGCTSTSSAVLSVAGVDAMKKGKTRRAASAARGAGSIETQENETAAFLVKDVFVGGDCFDVDDTSIQHTGDENAKGTFSNGASIIGIEEGVLLSTGRVSTAEGPNDYFDASTQLRNGGMNDPDLRQIVGARTSLHDISLLEFDFTPTSDQISFEYVFASEEYCEYAGSQFNDVFGFFISGPGINGPFTNGAENIALIPGTTDNVTINNLNYYSNEAYYVNNVPRWHHGNMVGLSCFAHTSNSGDFIDELEYDGFTTPLTAIAKVQACETYHIKLIVADVNDGYYDSAVFLKANSFSAGGTALVETDVPGFNGNIAYEDCSDGRFVFKRANADLEDSLTIHFNVSPLSTATAGLDYVPLPDSIIILPGDSLYYLPVLVMTDGLAEGIENILLDLDAPCSCNLPSIELQIGDVAGLDVVLDDVQLCEVETTRLKPEVNGGLAPYTYRWSTGESTAFIDVNPTSDATYTVTITDQCGAESINHSRVEILGVPTATISGYEFICAEKTSANIKIIFTGAGPWRMAYRYNDTATVMIDGITSNPYEFTVGEAGLYYLVSVNSNGCEGIVRGAATVFETNLDITYNYTLVSCPGKEDGRIDLQVEGGSTPYQYQWNKGLGSIEDPIDLPAGNYLVTVTDANGCTAEAGIELLYDEQVPIVEAGFDTVLTCRHPQIQLQGNGSSGADFETSWSTEDGHLMLGENSFLPTIDQPGTYRLSITNKLSACMQFDELVVGIDTQPPSPTYAFLGPQTLDCTNLSTLVDASASRPIGQVAFYWRNQAGQLLNNDSTLSNIELDAPGQFSLEVIDRRNGCSATLPIGIESDTDLPYIKIDPANKLSCKDSMIQLDAGTSDRGPAFRYQWQSSNGQIVSGGQTLRPFVEEAGAYELTIRNTETGCESTAAIEVAIDTIAPVAEAGETGWLTCDERSVYLDAGESSAGSVFSYQWTTEDGRFVSGEQSLRPLVDTVGRYQLALFNEENGCRAVDWVEVREDENRPRAIEVEIEAPRCFGEQGRVIGGAVRGGEAPYLFSFNGGSTFSDTRSKDFPAGSYSLIVEDANGCTYEESFDIPEVPPLIVTLGPDVEIPLGTTHSIYAQTNIPSSQIAQISWSPIDSLSCSDCLSPLANPVFNTLYEITLIDQNGCLAKDELMIRVDKERRIYIPNAFSPNSDGTNDRFRIFSDELSVRTINRLEIFDRWGNQLYRVQNEQTNAARSGWDGTFKGQLMPPGVYVYLAEIEFVDGVKKIYKGDITIVK